MVKTISYDQSEIIQWIIDLHIPKGIIDCDPTYSKGNFYKSIPKPTFRFDIDPKSDAVIADCRMLPIAHRVLDSVMFDPPFLATKGPSLSKNDDSNKIVKRFGVYETEKELHEFYFDSLLEFHRILEKDGILIVKCQDKVSSGKQYFSHVFIHNIAVEIGFYPKDLFILLARNRMVADWQRNQQHARKFHSYFWVFQKNNRTIQYIPKNLQ